MTPAQLAIKAALDANRSGTCEARYPGRCAWRGEPIKKGDTIVFTKKPSATLCCDCAVEIALAGTERTAAAGGAA